MDDFVVEQIAVSDEYLMAIGRIMVNWNQLEAIFDLLVIKLMGCRLWDRRSHIPIVDMPFGTKIDIARSLAGVQAKKDQQFFDKFMNETLPKITKLQEQRNAVAHYKWAIKDGAVWALRVKGKKKFTMTNSTVSLQTLHEASAEMVVLMDEVFRMIPLAEFGEGNTT
jgi:phosphopantetheinyl transferase (holo-ACP synthase)